MNLHADLLFKLILCVYENLDIKRTGSIFCGHKRIIFNVMNTKIIIIQEFDFVGHYRFLQGHHESFHTKALRQ